MSNLNNLVEDFEFNLGEIVEFKGVACQVVARQQSIGKNNDGYFGYENLYDVAINSDFNNIEPNVDPALITSSK